MKFQTILIVSDTPDNNNRVYSKESLKKVAEKNSKLIYEEHGDKGYLITTEIIEVNEKVYWSNPQSHWGGLFVTDITKTPLK